MRLASWRARGRKKGVLVTTEVALLLAVIVAIVIMAGLGWFRSILAQATSSKPSLVVDQAQGWIIGCDNSKETVAVSLYVQNVGNTPVYVNGETLVLPNGDQEPPVTSATPTINPGETAEISVAFSWSTSTETVSAGQSVYVYLQVSSASGNSNYVGTAVALENAPGATSGSCQSGGGSGSSTGGSGSGGYPIY